MTGLEFVNALNRSRPLVKPGSDEGDHPAELAVCDDEEASKFTALIFLLRFFIKKKKKKK